jgi:hypothetical protein
MGLTIERRMWMVDDDALNGLWMREQALLGLDRITSDEEFARGGLGAFAADPTVRIAVLPGDPSSQPVPAEKPEAVIPKTMTVGGRQLAYHGIVRGTSSGYVGYTIGNEGRCRASLRCTGTVAWTPSSASRVAVSGTSVCRPGGACSSCKDLSVGRGERSTFSNRW